MFCVCPARTYFVALVGCGGVDVGVRTISVTKDLTEDLQLAAVKRLLPNVDELPDDEALANAVLDVREVFENTVYAVAHDVIAILKRYAEVDKAVSGKADLPMLSVLQSIQAYRHAGVSGIHWQTPPDALASIERYLHADVSFV